MDLIEQQCIDECWQQIRSHGRRSFIVRYGLRRFALETGVFLWLALFVVVPIFFEGHETPNWSYVGSRPFWLSLAASALIWPLGGALWGLIEWNRREARFRSRAA